MTTKHDDGGPAYPVPSNALDIGMTLWDFYAAAALQGYMAARSCDVNHIASVAAQAADAMIAERRKRGIGQ